MAAGDGADPLYLDRPVGVAQGDHRERGGGARLLRLQLHRHDAREAGRRGKKVRACVGACVGGCVRARVCFSVPVCVRVYPGSLLPLYYCELIPVP